MFIVTEYAALKANIVANHDSFLAPISYNFIPLPSDWYYPMMIRLDQCVRVRSCVGKTK